jgi:hypothetical protein
MWVEAVWIVHLASLGKQRHHRSHTMTRFALRLRWPWDTPPEPPKPGDFAGKSIILASEGRPIPRSAVEFAGRMAKKAGAEVHVLSIARI